LKKKLTIVKIGNSVFEVYECRDIIDSKVLDGLLIIGLDELDALPTAVIVDILKVPQGRLRQWRVVHCKKIPPVTMATKPKSHTTPNSELTEKNSECVNGVYECPECLSGDGFDFVVSVVIACGGFVRDEPLENVLFVGEVAVEDDRDLVSVVDEGGESVQIVLVRQHVVLDLHKRDPQLVSLVVNVLQLTQRLLTLTTVCSVCNINNSFSKYSHGNAFQPNKLK
jgi:hypothetical protein